MTGRLNLYHQTTQGEIYFADGKNCARYPGIGRMDKILGLTPDQGRARTVDPGRPAPSGSIRAGIHQKNRSLVDWNHFLLEAAGNYRLSAAAGRQRI